MNPFQTCDFQLAAYAIYKGSQLISIDRSGRRKIFHLEMPIPEEQLTREFWGGEQVNISQYNAAMAEVKKRLYSDSF